MTITESDKKLLGYLAAFLIAVLFIFSVFRPLWEKISQIEEAVALAKEQELALDGKATLAQDMSQKEESTKQNMSQVVSRFYPMLQSQEAERMATTLMLNHHLSIQSLNIVMPETNNRLRWYQYSDAALEMAGQPAGEEEEDAFLLYSARVTCVAEGSEQDLWDFVNDISENYPAISIVSVEWAASEAPGTTTVTVEVPKPQPQEEDGEDAEGEEGMEIEEPHITVPVTVRTDRMSISLEIFMCNQ